MFIDHDAMGRGEPRRWDTLPDDEALLLWAMRRLVVAWPRCHAAPVRCTGAGPRRRLGSSI